MNSLASSATRLMPDSVGNALRIRRNVRFWRDAGAIFIHVPKAGGVSMSHALYGRPLGHVPAADVRRVIPREYHRLYSFALVRDPIDRLQSAYLFARHGSSGEIAMHNPSKYASRHFRSFESFVLEWLADMNVAELDGVFRPQAHYISEGGHVVVDDILPLEDLPRSLDRIESVLGRRVSLEHRNATRVQNRVTPSPAVLSVIHEKYREDFELLVDCYGIRGNTPDAWPIPRTTGKQST